MASTAAWSADSFSPRPTHRAEASAAASVTRTSSSARFRSGFSPERISWEITPPAGSSAIARGLADGPGRLALAAGGDQRAHERDARDHSRAEKRDPVPVVEADPELEPLVGRRAIDDAVVEDQDHGREPDDHRQLARLPAELVAADDDPGEDQRRQR